MYLRQVSVGKIMLFVLQRELNDNVDKCLSKSPQGFSIYRLFDV